jgi:hypothetical protein
VFHYPYLYRYIYLTIYPCLYDRLYLAPYHLSLLTALLSTVYLSTFLVMASVVNLAGECESRAHAPPPPPHASSGCIVKFGPQLDRSAVAGLPALYLPSPPPRHSEAVVALGTLQYQLSVGGGGGAVWKGGGDWKGEGEWAGQQEGSGAGVSLWAAARAGQASWGDCRAEPTLIN